MPGLDDQDQSEIFDENNADVSETGSVTEDYASFEEMPGVPDLTSTVDDAVEPEVEETDDGLSGSLGNGGIEFDVDRTPDPGRFPETEIDPDTDPPGEGEVELVYSGLMENVRGAQASAARWEADALSDEDIVDLGYGPEAGDRL